MLTEEQKQEIYQAKIEEFTADFARGEFTRAFDYCRWNENRLSRAAFRALRPDAPEVNAPQKAWVAYFKTIPEFVEAKRAEAERAEAEARAQAEAEARAEAERAEKRKADFVGGKTLTGSDFVALCRSLGVPVPMRTAGFIAEKCEVSRGTLWSPEKTQVATKIRIFDVMNAVNAALAPKTESEAVSA